MTTLEEAKENAEVSGFEFWGKQILEGPGKVHILSSKSFERKDDS